MTTKIKRYKGALLESGRSVFEQFPKHVNKEFTAILASRNSSAGRLLLSSQASRPVGPESSG